jgi:CRP-like cAMP-binding protein
VSPHLPTNATGNRLLNMLAAPARDQASAACETVELRIGEILCNMGESIRHVYFPMRGYVSLISPLAADVQLEMGMAGSEGMVGSTLALEVGLSPFLCIVQGAGTALRMSAGAFKSQLDANPPMNELARRYVHVTVAQMGQTGACHRFHVIQKRLARWLLMTRDRAADDQFPITQEVLADMLGARRPALSVAASALQKRGLINYRHGQMTILDVDGLLSASCDCYQSAKDIYNATFPPN